jgi:coenzyme F420-reducing hydrogenase alpha subunit
MRKMITLEHITKIEGHAKLTVRIERNKVREVDLDAFEGARYFEGILKGRKYSDASVLTSRICGICSCIHTTCACQAIEDALKIEVTEQTKTLRELLCLAEQIRSHATHLYFFVLPDYLGFSSAIAMAGKHRVEVTRALDLIKLGNDIISALSGREMHPVAVIAGGFSQTPDDEELEKLEERLESAKKDALKTAELFSHIPYPDFNRETNYFTLDNDRDYALLDGKISGVGSYHVPTKSYAEHFKEYMKPSSTAKFVLAKGRENYSVGALARVNQKMSHLSKDALNALRKTKIAFPCHNPFVNNICQAVELIHAVDRCVEIIDDLTIRDEKPVKPKARAGRGISVVEAPRGLLFHDYTLDDKGVIQKANIITPTAQNIKNIENDLTAFIPTTLNQPKKEITLSIEKLVRAYDPCISCSAHFLEINWK